MSNVVTFTPGAVPAHLRNQQPSALSTALAGAALGGPRLSIKGGVFRLVLGGKEITRVDDRHLDVVIVAAAPHVGRTYYAQPYDEDAPATPPSCWSADGQKPDPTVKNPQASACLRCPQNQPGSGQGESRACRYSQRIAVVLANDIGGQVLQLSLPATSLFGKENGDKRPLQAYARWLAAQNVSPDTVVTRLKFDTAAATPKLYFSAVRWLTQEEYQLGQEQGASDAAQQAITFTVAQQDGVSGAGRPVADPLPGTPPTAPAPASAPAAQRPRARRAEPVQEVVEAEEVTEPNVRTASAPAAAVRKDLADLVDEWDD